MRTQKVETSHCNNDRWWGSHRSTATHTRLHFGSSFRLYQYISAFDEALFLLQINLLLRAFPWVSHEAGSISSGAIILRRSRTLMMYWCKINLHRICVPMVPRTNTQTRTLTAVRCLMGRAFHRQSVCGCELVLPLKSWAVIYNVLTSPVSHSELCLLALTNTTRDKTEMGWLKKCWLKFHLWFHEDALIMQTFKNKRPRNAQKGDSHKYCQDVSYFTPESKTRNSILHNKTKTYFIVLLIKNVVTLYLKMYNAL